MNKFFKVGAVLAICSVLVTGAFAQGKKPMMKKAPMHKMMKPVNCPVCKMPLSMKKTAANPVAIHLNGKTMYCCSGCTMPKSVMGAMPGKKHMMGKKPMMKKPMMKKKS
jgi:hypothetical protein